MAKTGNIVRFLHFTGTETLWNSRINNGDWDNAVVFGYIYNDEKSKIITKQIYGGKDSQNLKYLYELTESDNHQQIEFSTYDQAAEYIESSEAKNGQLVLVKTGKKSGNYIILTNADNKFILQLLQHNDALWSYGDSSIWHNENDSTTATVGGIKKGTILKNLISETNGELSRIIEKMLFYGDLPSIKAFSVEQNPDKIQRGIIVDFQVECATDYTTFLYINTIASKSGAEVIENTTGLINVNDREPNTKYYLLAEISNEAGTATSEWKSITTAPYIMPVVTIPDITYYQKEYTNNALLTVQEATFELNDYILDTNSIVYKLQDADTLEILATGITKINKVLVEYQKTYNLILTYNIKYYDETGDWVEQVNTKSVTVSAYPKEGKIYDITVEGSEYVEGVEYEIKDEEANIIFSANARLYSATAEVTYYNDEEHKFVKTYKTINSYISEQEVAITKEELGLPNSKSTVTIKLYDEYGTIDIKVIKLKYCADGAIVEISVESGSNVHRDTIVTYSIIGQSITSKKLYLCPIQSIEQAIDIIELDNLSGTYTFNNLEDGTKYYFCIEVINNVGQSIKWTSLTTTAYIEPIASLDITNDRLVPTGNSNYLGINLSESDFVVTYNDYVKNGDIIYKINGQVKTLTEIITANNYLYKTEYKIEVSVPVVLADGTDPSVKIVSATKTLLKNPADCLISISQVDGQPYEAVVYNLTKNDVKLTISATPGIYDASISFTINEEEPEIQKISGPQQNIEKTFEDLPISDNTQTIKIKIWDEYSDKTVTFRYTYKSAVSYFLSVLTKDSYATYTDEKFIQSNEGSDKICADDLFDMRDVSSKTPTQLESLVYDENIEWFDDSYFKGFFKNFFVDANCLTPMDILQDASILIDDTTKNKRCYGYTFKNNYDNGILMMYIPSGYSVQFYENGLSNVPDNELKTIHVEGHQVQLNGNYYDLWYYVSNDELTEWNSYKNGDIKWIKIY